MSKRLRLNPPRRRGPAKAEGHTPPSSAPEEISVFKVRPKAAPPPTVKVEYGPQRGRSSLRQVELVVDLNAPPLAQAASIALAVLRHCGSRRWDDLGKLQEENPHRVARLLSNLRVTVDQGRLVKEWEPEMTLLRWGAPRSGDDTITLGVCTDCGRYILVARPGGAPARCLMTLGCDGRTVVARVAKEVPVAAPSPVTGPPASVESGAIRRSMCQRTAGAQHLACEERSNHADQ